jgi:hypothetical protein
MVQLSSDVASVILEYADYFKRAVLFDILFPGSRRLCYGRNLKEIKCFYGTYYSLFGKTHREEDLPAMILNDGNKLCWYINNELSRGGDKPHIVRADGDMRWYKDGNLNREGDLPALICANGDMQWYKDGLLHREGDLPAVICKNGTQSWYHYGKRHRDGDKPAYICSRYQSWYIRNYLHRENYLPAVVYSDGIKKYWYRNGLTFCPPESLTWGGKATYKHAIHEI